MADPMILHGRRALVTGADQGIGRILARALNKAGAEVVIHHFGAEDRAKETLFGAEVYEADFTQPGAAASLAAKVLQGGPVDIFIANAAIEKRGPWEEISTEDVSEHVSANFTSLLTLCQQFVPRMVEGGWGRVVAIGSVMATRPRAESVVYAALKSAQLTTLRAIAREVASSGVTLNAIAPGAIETERTADKYASEAFRTAVISKIPAGRQGQSEDCIAPVLMLCTNEASYITGVEIPVDGGWSLGDAPGSLPGSEQ